jgi:hypothetical protein
MSEVLNHARNCGVQIEALAGNGRENSVFKITVPAAPPALLLDTDLAEVIQEGERFFQSGQETTVWLCIEDASFIPAVVLRALDLCRAYGVGLFVSQGAKCTHAPGQPIDARVTAAVKLAHRGGAIYHPIAGMRVQG